MWNWIHDPVLIGPQSPIVGNECPAADLVASVKRIFLTLSLVANAVLLYAITRGLNIEDAAVPSAETQQQVGLHMLIGLGALTFATLIHAISLTYFMGTGRFLEETSNAYSLSPDYCARSQQLKYRMLPGMVVCLLLLISTGALGAVADPATQASLAGTLGMTDAQIHLTGAIVTLLANLLATAQEYRSVSENSSIVDQVLADVQRIRRERGLPVE